MNKEHTNAIPLNKQVIQGVDNTSRSIVDGVYRYRFWIAKPDSVNQNDNTRIVLTDTLTPDRLDRVDLYNALLTSYVVAQAQNDDCQNIASIKFADTSLVIHKMPVRLSRFIQKTEIHRTRPLLVPLAALLASGESSCPKTSLSDVRRL